MLSVGDYKAVAYNVNLEYPGTDQNQNVKKDIKIKEFQYGYDMSIVVPAILMSVTLRLLPCSLKSWSLTPPCD